MDLRPIQRILAVSPVQVKQAGEEVAPPFAPDGTLPMENDSYSAGGENPDRGLEEAEPEDVDGENVVPNPPSDDPPPKVNFFA